MEETDFAVKTNLSIRTKILVYLFMVASP